MAVRYFLLSGGWPVVGRGGGLFLAAQMLQGLHLDPPRTRCVRGALEMH